MTLAGLVEFDGAFVDDVVGAAGVQDALVGAVDVDRERAVDDALAWTPRHVEADDAAVLGPVDLHHHLQAACISEGGRKGSVVGGGVGKGRVVGQLVAGGEVRPHDEMHPGVRGE